MHYYYYYNGCLTVFWKPRRSFCMDLFHFLVKVWDIRMNLHMIMHFDLAGGGALAAIITWIAASNTCFKPSWVLDEHSMYRTPPTSLHSCSPRAVEIFSLVLASDRKSTLVPTRMKGTPGASFSNSGTHLFLTFSKELASTQIRKILV